MPWSVFVETHRPREYGKNCSMGLKSFLHGDGMWSTCGITIEEMDVDAILARKPQVVLVDELAHTNAPDSRNPKRYQDVQELTGAGIHVISTMNVQHLESLYNTVESLLGVKVRERAGCCCCRSRLEVVKLGIDRLTRARWRRISSGSLREGKVSIQRTEPTRRPENFFTQSNLAAYLRELTLLRSGVCNWISSGENPRATSPPTTAPPSRSCGLSVIAQDPTSAQTVAIWVAAGRTA